jgi:chromate transporter
MSENIMTGDGRTLAELSLVFLPLSLVSIGGGPAVLAEMQHQAVAIHGWMTEREFLDLFAISRAAPGPGALIAILIGWKAAGWLGALTVSIAFFLPTSLVVYGMAYVWRRWPSRLLQRIVEAGFAPIAPGLVLASSYVMLQSAGTRPLAWAAACSVAAWRMWQPDRNPIVILGFGTAAFVIAKSLI